MVARRWEPGQLEALRAAVDNAAAGRTTVVVIEGEAGLGKSSLLEQLTELAAGFAVVSGEGVESSTAEPYGMLARCGVDLAVSGGGRLGPELAAQRLRELIDAHPGPTLLIVDDAQWADPESIEVIVDVVARAMGDPLLVAIGTRPVAPDGSPRWAARPDRLTRVDLTGLGRAAAVDLIHELRPEIDTDTADAVWRHTGGNPLYLTLLVQEYGRELARMPVLPAPAAFAATVAAKLARLPGDCVEVAQAVAVLGAGWVSMLDVAELSGLGTVVDAMQRLLDDGLLQLRRATPVDTVRIPHGLIRAAVYQDTPIARRQALHAAAAGIVTGRAAVLDHRVAASGRYDEELAVDLEAYARGLHQQLSHRLAAYYWRAASALSRRPAERERRWLEALFETVLSGDRAGVRAELPEVAQAEDAGRRALVEGALAQWERHPLDAVAILSDVLEQVAEIDSATRYRLLVLLAWASVQASGGSEGIQAALDAAALLEPKDPALRRFTVLCRGQLVARRGDLAELHAIEGDLPENPVLVPLAATELLAWRGVLGAGAGRFKPAIADLGELIARMQKGQTSFGGGAFHALLGLAQWFDGQWSLARVNLTLAGELSPGYPHPTAAALAPLLAVMSADDEAVAESTRSARALLAHLPWPEAVDHLDVVEVIAAHAAGRGDGVRYDSLRPTVQAVGTGTIRKSVVWLTHAAQAAIWAGDLTDAELCAHAVQNGAAQVGWAEPIAQWLLGLIAEARGKGAVALGHLRTALAGNAAAVPLYRAHVLSDHARVAQILGDPAAAGRSLEQALAGYRDLGAGTYVERIEALKLISPPPQGGSLRSAPVLAFSNRERDVLALVSEGLSYAQIARDLFITQKTVGYHLGNIYAKANVRSRHELTELVRREPALFGLSAAG